jgi:hypothetical protein
MNAASLRGKEFSFVSFFTCMRISAPDKTVWHSGQFVSASQCMTSVALDYFRRLGHDNHRRLSKLYAWEEKKSKTSWGAQTVDYEKIAAAAVRAMKAADVNRFLVVCALVSDLYCPGYNPRQPLERNSNLSRTALRYKVDSAKIAAAVGAELSMTNAKTNSAQPVGKEARKERPDHR